jgi:predicted HTH transcriptional regulator
MDAVKHTFTLTAHLLPQTIDRITQSVIVTSTGASNRIEGNNVEDFPFEYVLSEKQQAFWTWAKTQETFSRKDVVEALGYGNRTTEEIIKKLYNMKKLERFGEGRATRDRVL